MKTLLQPRFLSVAACLPFALCAMAAQAAKNCEGTCEADQAFVHPGISHSQASIDFVKAKIAASEEPWLSDWEQLERSRHGSLRWKPDPQTHVERGPYNHPDIGSSEFSRDATAAYNHALLWALSGKEAHARKSREILNAWSYELESISNHDAKLLVGMTGLRICNAAELLRHTWNGWSEKDQKQFRVMLVEVWAPIIEGFYPSANGNWDASIMQTSMAMGVFLDDKAMFDRAVEYYLEGDGNGAIQNYFNEFGECQESGRDQTHTQMGLEFLANTCETAWNQGVDLYKAHDNRLLLGFEYTAKYNLGHEVPFEPYRSYEGRYYYESIATEGRGRIRPMYAKVYNHYHNRMGLEADFTREASLKVRRGRRRGGGASLPWDRLMFTGQSLEATVTEPAPEPATQAE